MDDPLARAFKDGIYAAVGLGLLTFQRAQVERRELEKRLRPQIDSVLDEVRHLFDG